MEYTEGFFWQILSHPEVLKNDSFLQRQHAAVKAHRKLLFSVRHAPISYSPAPSHS